MTENIKNDFKSKLSSVLFDETMKKHTTFKIGGPAEIFIDAGSKEEVLAAIELCHKNNLPFMIIGNGSNLLVSDKGISGAVICVGNRMKNIEVKDNVMYAECGALLSVVSNTAQKHSLSGLEFAAGIPGTLGGGVYMNAGAYGGELKDVVRRVTYIDDEGNIKKAEENELDFSYRHSMFSDKNFVILEAELELKAGDAEKIRAEMTELNKRRCEKQPLEFPSAGSTFKRPEGYFAGKLIQDSGLSGYTIGGAKVSEKHAGFVINNGDATAQDVLNLIAHIQKTVFEKFGVNLETEVRLIGIK